MFCSLTSENASGGSVLLMISSSSLSNWLTLYSRVRGTAVGIGVGVAVGVGSGAAAGEGTAVGMAVEAAVAVGVVGSGVVVSVGTAVGAGSGISVSDCTYVCVGTASAVGSMGIGVSVGGEVPSPAQDTRAISAARNNIGSVASPYTLGNFLSGASELPMPTPF